MRGKPGRNFDHAIITRAQLRAELDELLRRAHIEPRSVKLRFSRAVDRDHARHRRNHARVDLDKREIQVAQAILALDAPHRLGILAHEVGHFCCNAKFGPGHTEAQTDECAKDATGVMISYDHSWPGQNPLDPDLKGLQVGTDLRRSEAKTKRQLQNEIDVFLRSKTARRSR